MANGLCDKYCSDCMYKHAIGLDGCLCGYYLATNKRRPCPAGEGCTVKEIGKRQSAWTAENNAAWEKMIQKRKETRARNNLLRMKTKECAHCGETYESYNPRQKYCSRRCKDRATQRRLYWEKKGPAMPLEVEI